MPPSAEETRPPSFRGHGVLVVQVLPDGGTAAGAVAAAQVVAVATHDSITPVAAFSGVYVHAGLVLPGISTEIHAV